MTKTFGDTELFKTKADCEELQTTQNIDQLTELQITFSSDKH